MATMMPPPQPRRPCLSRPLNSPSPAFSLFPKPKLPFLIKASSTPNASPSSEPPKPATADPVKLAFERAKAYKKSTKPSPVPVESPAPNPESRSSPGDYLSVKMALERAGVSDMADSDTTEAKGSQTLSGSGMVEKKGGKKEEATISSIDFMGLNFADKKKGRGLPAGLMPVLDMLDVPDSMEVEFIAGDMSGFREAKVVGEVEEEEDVYKPKVSTWGVFPRPGNISKTVEF